MLGRNQLMQTINANDKAGLDSVAARLDQVTTELQEAIMRTRMQPIGAVFSHFPRVVRDLSSKLGKQCDIVMDGKEVEVDKTILEAIGDPLTHLVRNSIDHGVEPPDVRTASGKKAKGTVTLRAYHQAGKVRIDVADDGAGIDADAAAAEGRREGRDHGRAGQPHGRPRDGPADLPPRLLDGGEDHRRQRPRRRHGRRPDEHRKARRHGRRRFRADQGHDDSDHAAAHAGDYSRR